MTAARPSPRLLRFALPAALLALPGCGELDAAAPTAEAQAPLTEQAPDQRYIVQYRNARGLAAVREQRGRVALELPARAAVAAYLPAAAVEALSRNPNIAAIEVDARRMPLGETTPYGIGMVQADQVDAAPPSGDDGRTRVCVIDSGISAAHPDFAGLPITGSNDSGSGAWNTDLCGHGTHVAGTIAAVAGNGIGVVGVAPEAARLHIVKVFGGANCGWTYSSGLVAALDACRAAGAQVVSMSLGGSTKSRFEESAFADAEAAGVLSIAAAGNDGNTRKSYPASYPAVVSVAAVDSAGQIADFSQQNDAVEIAAPGVAVQSTYPYAHQLTVGGETYLGEPMDNAASATVSGALAHGGLCDSVGAWGGKVVLCARGDIDFAAKVANVQAGGGLGAAIYNNEPGPYFGTLGDFAASIPAISLSQEDGQALVAGALGAQGELLSGLGHGYASLDGTSMATPHVSGVAALLWAHFPGATNAEIRAAMTATAVDLGAAGRDNAFGYGLVQTRAAYDHLAGGGAGGAGGGDGGGGAGGGGECLSSGDTCVDNADCCSGTCRSRRGVSTCR